ncbi:MAG: Bug family tripartite tricarboxylate transporter substrate binding protein [Reyranellaceae bacterium]
MKRFVKLILLTAMLAASGGLAAQAQEYPNQPIRLVVASTPGGLMDPFGRTIGDWLQKAWGQPVLLEHKPGAGGLLSGDFVAAAKPDGHTLWLTYGGPLVNVPAFGQTRYDVERDFSPVAMLVTVPNVVVVPAALPVKTLPELVALSKSRSGGLNYGSAGVGASQHMSGELFKLLTGANLTHIPYKGAAGAITDLVAGRIDVMFTNIPPVMPHIQAGLLRPIAVTVPNRADVLPDVPTPDEAGIRNFHVTGLVAIMAPANVPKDILARLNSEINKAMASEEGKRITAASGGQFTATSIEGLARFLRDEQVIWKRVIAENKIVLEN